MRMAAINARNSNAAKRIDADPKRCVSITALRERWAIRHGVAKPSAATSFGARMTQPAALAATTLE